MPLPEAVLFDMDGTLTDTETLWFTAEQELFHELGYEWQEAEAKAVIGKSLIEAVRILVENSGVDISLEEFRQRLLEKVESLGQERGMPWRPGAYELLQLLVELNIPTALVTSSYRKFAQLTIDQAPQNSLTVLVSGEMTALGKPHPMPYLVAAEKLGVNIKNCVIFEDSIPGLCSAQATGAHAVAVPFQVELPKLEKVIFIDSLERVNKDFLQSLV